jgi:hypothetical protein
MALNSMALNSMALNSMALNSMALNSMVLTLMDPTNEKSAVERTLTKRRESLDGITVALLDISKPRGNVFLDELENQLNTRGIKTKRYRKPTYTKPAPIDLRHEIALECGAVIEALAD